MAKHLQFKQLIIFLVLGCTPILNAQGPELNPPLELPAPPQPKSLQSDLDLSERDIERLFDFTSPDEQPAVENKDNDNAARTAATETLPVQVREFEGEPVTRGPIHEAFAEPFSMLPQDTLIVPKTPPAAVEEIPPTRPEQAGSNTEWISGYWAWDTQAEDYIWVSGVWRKKPKDRLWLPGRWEVVNDGHQWIPGAWMPTDGEEQIVKREVLPLPPRSLDQGPTSPAPSDEHFWVPGVWQRNDARYAWRAGYWSRSQKNWVWVPDHYASVADGCLFVPGYWDYTWDRRGTLYAPCTFAAAGDQQVCYRPTQVIDTNQWLTNLWVAPRTAHYHFGDYHNYGQLGYQPWYQYYGSNRAYYDPFYTYYRWQFPRTYGCLLYTSPSPRD